MNKIIKSQKIFFYLLLVCSFGIGVQSDIYKYAIIALLLQWLFSFDFLSKLQRLKSNKPALLLIIFYLFYAVSFFWSDNIYVALTDLLLKTPLFLLPLILASSSPPSKDQINKILLAFCLSSLCINLYSFGNAYLNYLENRNINSFYYYRLTVNMHSAYQAMFSCFSIAALIYLNIKERVIKNWLMYVGVAFQLLFVLLLSSRMQILIMIVLVPYYFISRYYRKNKLYLGITYTILIFSFGYLLIAQPSSLNYRYKQSVYQINSIGLDNDNSDPRKFIWIEGAKVIKENWLFGVGTGDAKDKLIAMYKDKIIEEPFNQKTIDSTRIELNKDKKLMLAIYELSKNNGLSLSEQTLVSINNKLEFNNNKYNQFVDRAYNYHNQYLQSFGTIGLCGILILAILIVVPGIQLFIKKRYLEVIFLFIIGASFLTESMLERQAGVAFISFFYTILIVLKFNNQNKSF